MTRKQFAVLGVGVAGLVTLLSSQTAQAYNPGYSFCQNGANNPGCGQYVTSDPNDGGGSILATFISSEYSNGFGNFAGTYANWKASSVYDYWLDTQAYCSDGHWYEFGSGYQGPWSAIGQSTYSFCPYGTTIVESFGSMRAAF